MATTRGPQRPTRLSVHNIHTHGQPTPESRGYAQLSPRTRVTYLCIPVKPVKIPILPIEQSFWFVERRCRGNNLVVVIRNEWKQKNVFRNAVPDLLVGAGSLLGFLS